MTVIDFREKREKKLPSLNLGPKNHTCTSMDRCINEKYRSCKLIDGGLYDVVDNNIIQHFFVIALNYDKSKQYDLYAELGVVLERQCVPNGYMEYTDLKAKRVTNKTKLNKIKNGLEGDKFRNLNKNSTDMLNTGFEKTNDLLAHGLIVNTNKSVVTIGNKEYNLKNKKIEVYNNDQTKKELREMNRAEIDEVEHLLKKKRDRIL